MKAMKVMKAMMFAAVAIAAGSAACGNDHAEPDAGDEAMDDDPLAVTNTPPAGSLDDLHQRIFAKRCSGQPGLCHNGQFEPNLSTPAMTYAYLVGRPGLEKADRLRVKPGDAAGSLMVDKLRNRGGVATQMPLGAEPLDEADIKALEAWIDAGALRAPGAAPAPQLNNPPHRPEIGIFDAGGTRLDGTGAVRVTAGTTLVLRHSVQDFETPDAAIPFAAVILAVADGRDVVLDPTPTATDPQLGRTTYDANGPISKGDRLNYQRSWTIGSTLTLYDTKLKTRADVPASGQVVTVLVVYLDATQGIAALEFGASQIQIQ
jgi:hypothetical protein